MLPTDRIAYLIDQHVNASEQGVHEAVDVLMSMKGWQDKFTRKYIAQRLRTLINEEIHKGLPSTKIKSAVLNFISEMESLSPVSTVHVPIEGLQITKPLEIGNVEFYPHSKRRISALRKKAKDVILSTKHSPEAKRHLIDDIDKRYFDPFTSNAYAKIDAKAVRQKAIESAISEVETALDVLRIAIPRIAGRTKSEFMYKTRVNIQGREASTPRYLFAFSDDGFHYNASRELNHDFVIRGRWAWKQIRDLGIPHLSRILKCDSRSELENQLLDAVHWFSLGVTQRNPYHQYLSYAFAAETLVSSQSVGGSIKNSIVETSAYLLSSKKEARLRVRDRMKKALKQRDRLVHGGSKDQLSIDTIRSLEGLSLGLISTVAKRSEEWGTKGELFAWAEEQKFS